MKNTVTTVTTKNHLYSRKPVSIHRYCIKKTLAGTLYVCTLPGATGAGECGKEFRNVLSVQQHQSVIHGVSTGPKYFEIKRNHTKHL